MSNLGPADLRILRAVQQDCDRPLEDLAGIVGQSPSQCSRRISRLRGEGFIQRRVALLDPEKLGLEVTAYALVSLASHDESSVSAFCNRISALPEVLECAKITGSADYVLKIRTPDLATYDRILTDYVLRSAGVSHVQSSIVLQDVKSTTELPLSYVEP